jgi:hypothetical protein
MRMSNGRFLIYLEKHKKAVGETSPALPADAAEPPSEKAKLREERSLNHREENAKLIEDFLKNLEGAKPAHSEEKYTLEEAFDYFNIPDDEPGQCELNNERCVRAAGFLLHYCSEHGNENVHGFIAHGLGVVLEKCASNIAQMCRQRLRKQVGRG